LSIILTNIQFNFTIKRRRESDIMKKFENKFLIIISIFLSIYLIYTFNINDDLQYRIKFIKSKIYSTYYGHKNVEKKYLIYTCDQTQHCGGWSDRSKGIISGYIWAQLTNRIFIIDIKVPCELSNFLLPNKVNWIGNISSITHDYHSNGSILNRMNDLSFKQLLQRIDFTSIGNDTNYIILRTNRNYVDSFGSNKLPKIQNLVNKLCCFPDKLNFSSIFNHVYQKLFKLTPRLQTIFNK
jgi:hypothetical protein